MDKKAVSINVWKLIASIIWIFMGYIFILIGSVRIGGALVDEPEVTSSYMQATSWNDRFNSYIGKNKESSKINSLFSEIRITNPQNNPYLGKIAVNYFDISENGDIISSTLTSEADVDRAIREIEKKVMRNKTNTYTVLASQYDKNGFIRVISIIVDGEEQTRQIDVEQYSFSDYFYKDYSTPVKSSSNKEKTKSNNINVATIVGVSLIIVGVLSIISAIPIIKKRGYTKESIITLYIIHMLFIIALNFIMFIALANLNLQLIAIAVIAVELIVIINIISKNINKIRQEGITEEILKKVYSLESTHACLMAILALLFLIIVPGALFVSAKPIIYIYPEKEMTLNVELGHPELLTTTYPKYEDGWKIKSYPNGDMEDLKNNNRKLYSLYWEGKNPKLNTSLEEGFVVKGEEVAEFLNKKLEQLGLNYKEKEEFIIYWLPKLEHNKYNFIRFALNGECEEYMPLSLKDENGEAVTPDTLIRVLMVFKPLNRKIDIREQVLPTQERNGFTVVEWGGSEI